MFAKLTVAILLSATIGAALLSLRQQRLSLMYETTKLHSQINRDNQKTWDLQVRINERTSPSRLLEAIEYRQLNLVPITPTEPTTPPQLAEANR